MRTYDCPNAAMNDEYGIKIGRWNQYPDLRGLPFDAMWCVVAPGTTSAPDRHPETEFAVVVDGTAAYESGGHRVEAPAGTVVVLDSDEPHVIHNDTERPLTILSLYWLPGDGAGSEATS